MNKDCFRHAMYFGLLLGVLFFIHFAVSLLHNTSLSVMLQLVMKIVIPVVAVRFAIDCRRRVNADVFSYSQVFRYFVILFLAASLVCSTLIFVYVQWINIDYLTDLKAQTEEAMEQIVQATGFSSLLSETEIEQALEMSYTTRMFVTSNFIGNFIIGIIIGLLGSLVVRNDKN